MKTTIKLLRSLINEVIEEGQWGGPTGPIRGSKTKRSAGGRQIKAGKIEEPNRVLSPIEVNEYFPGAVDAWVEVAPEMFPEREEVVVFGGDPNPRALKDAIKKATVWTKVGDTLRVGFKDEPMFDVARWDSSMGEGGDWVDEIMPHENPNPLKQNSW